VTGEQREAPAAVECVELSHMISDGMPVFPGLARPRITAFLDHEQSRAHYQGEAEFYISKLELVGNTGTYLDSPFHRDREGSDLSEIPLESVAGVRRVVLDGTVGPDRAVSLDDDEALLAGSAVLIRTGWDARWGTVAYWEQGCSSQPTRSSSCSARAPGSSVSTSGTSTTAATRLGKCIRDCLPRRS
jgi:arylformamidase